MSRNIEISIGEHYHIYNRGIDKRLIFKDRKDYERFVVLLYLCNDIKPVHLNGYRGLTSSELYKIQRENTLVDIGAYCLMPNHFHILIKEKIQNGISLFMQKLSTGYTMYFNKKYERTGSLFSGTFKASYANNDEYLKYLFSYIHLNPLALLNNKERFNLTSKENQEFLESYRFSSYQKYIGRERLENNIISSKDFPEYFKNSTDFIEFIRFWIKYDYPEVKPRD